ncbi:HipA family kinase [Hymenobacter profundi]|uniref:HipA-like kinase domain-containing protein n=1 Tax=Hymenobacter profundi TaxID=1982110 RepID=A0ABS6WWZ5_9BACT|nr:HipA family kinase [Hymenobacter profundi]MBW3127303.1 hypothetical protein [Hymenobacter profundi]
MLITDSAYRLPLVYALKPDQTLTSGANRPLLIRGVDAETEEEGDYVLKGSGAERMSVEAFERELLGCFAAWQVGLQAVTPVQIDVSPEFLALMRGREEYGLISRSLGRNFGSEYQRGLREFVTGQPLTTAELEQAQLIFAFDVLINNVDRNALKQNMLTDGQRIVLLDHELAFSFTKVLPFLRSRQPWLLEEVDVREWIQKHYFFPHLRGRQFDFTTLVPQLSRLDTAFWQAARQHTPTAWQTEQVDDIEAYICQVLSHVLEFTQELNRVTA